MVRGGYTPGDEVIYVYKDEIQNLADYEYYKRMNEHFGKPLSVTKRPEVKPANALPVKRRLLEHHQNYVRFKEQARREGKTIWVLEEEEEE